MIVIGVDVHKQSLTAVAVNEAGRSVGEETVAAANGDLLAWARELDEERLWALEDCRQLTRWRSGSCSRQASSWCGCRQS